MIMMMLTIMMSMMMNDDDGKVSADGLVKEKVQKAINRNGLEA